MVGKYLKNEYLFLLIDFIILSKYLLEERCFWIIFINQQVLRYPTLMISQELKERM